MRRAFTAGIVVASLLIGWKLTTRLSDLTVKCDEYPVSAFRYIAERGLNGKMVCTFNWAQYALAAFGPPADGGSGHDGSRIQIHSDGRLRTSYPQEILDMHFDFILGDHPEMRRRSPNSPACDGNRILAYRSPDLILLDRGQAPSRDVMQQNRADWVLLYQDSLAQLWGRATKYDDPSRPEYIAPERRIISEQVQTGTVSWPALPSRKLARHANHAGNQDSTDSSIQAKVLP